MIKEILYKLFGIEPFPCASCETLKMQLAIANEERKEILSQLLEQNRPKIEIPSGPPKEFKPIGIPAASWNVRKQMLEAEDREKSRIIRSQLQEVQPNPEIEKLENELGIENAPTGTKS